jgi:peptidoglycan/xylan/chitin deacetylase (PgdA/CDA1 family)
MKRWGRFAAGTFAVLGAGAALAAGPVPGDRVEPFSLPQPGGRTFRWKPGTATVLTFCAFWCDTWKEQGKRLGSAQKALAGLPVEFITVSVDARWSERGAGKIPGRVLLDAGSSWARSLGIDSIPYTAVIAPDGRVRYAAQGIVRAAAVQQAVREAAGGEQAFKSGTVYLTFDDFPSQDLDDRLLDVLRAQRVPATFFCIGSRVQQHRDVVRRAVREGHSLQVHSWDHQPSGTNSPAAELSMLEKCVRAIGDVAGVEPTLYRPAGRPECSKIGARGALRTPFRTALVVNPYDYTRPGEKELGRRVLLAAKPGCIVLLHAGVSETIDALPGVIRSLRNQGFTFDVLK